VVIGHWDGQLFGYVAQAHTSDVQRQAATDHLDLVQATLKQKIRQQRVRLPAACATNAADPYVFGTWAAHPPPVATPTHQTKTAAWARLVAHLELLPQREIG
jgi:hypothetical protein